MPKHPGHHHAPRLPSRSAAFRPTGFERSSRACRVRSAAALTLLLALACPFAGALAAQPTHVSFYEVTLDDSDFADEVLRRYLKHHVPELQFTREPFPYQQVIEELARADDTQVFLARTTPYVLVAALTLGADLDVLATYRGRAKDATTYRSYYVVNRERLGRTGPINRGDLAEWLKRRSEDGRPVRFAYHSKFSTSSYFVPSLFFRELGFYAVGEQSGAPNEILTEEVGGGSTDLVKRVAKGEADLAAVWDGTKTKFETGGEYAELGGRLAFVELETVIPNDLLVASSNLDPTLKTRLREAIADMTEETLESFASDRERAQGKSLGDFRYWLDLRSTDPRHREGASEARAALANLRRLSRLPPAPVIVRVQLSTEADKELESRTDGERLGEALVEAAGQAILLSGSELGLFVEGIHDQADMVWELSLIHDGAVRLKSTIRNFGGLEPQTFSISHKGRGESFEDLTLRIGDLIHTRLHRIRYLWPYRTEPTVIRDVAFDLPAESPVKIQTITWIDPESNLFSKGKVIDASVVDSDYSTFRLKLTDNGNGTAPDLADPLSNTAYRVALVRPSRETGLLKAFTGLYVLLMIVAVVFAAIEQRRRVAASSEARERPELAMVTG